MMLVAIALAAASAATPDAGIPAFFTGEKLLDICTAPHSGQCWMYVAGVLDGSFLSEANAAQPSICRRKLTNEEAAQRVVSLLKSSPDMQQRAAAVAVIAATESELRCPGNDAAETRPTG